MKSETKQKQTKNTNTKHDYKQRPMVIDTGTGFIKRTVLSN